MFFGTVLTPGGECVPDANEGEILHVSQACLFNPTSNEKTYLQVCEGDKSYALCALQKDKQENVSLDIFVTTRSNIRFKTSGGKNDVHLVGYFEPEDDSDLDNLSDQSYDEDEEGDEDVSFDSKSKEGDDSGKDSDDEEDDEESDEDADKEDNVESKDGSDDEDFDDEESEASAKKPSCSKLTKKVPEKLQDKAHKSTSAVQSKKRKMEVNQSAKSSKTPKFETTSKSPESEFEKQIVDYLKKNGRCMISQLAGKVRKPEALKNVKYQNFLKSKPNFVIEGQFVALKN